MLNGLKLKGEIEIKGVNEEVYTIEQADCDSRFYITSNRGYNGWEGDGFNDLKKAINKVYELIDNDLIDLKSGTC